MKINKGVLTDKVREALMKKCTTAIVSEAFVNSLPFNHDEVLNELPSLVKYCNNVVNKMHPETLIDRAIESTMDNRNANSYLRNLKACVESVVDDATDRIVNESMDTDDTLPEIVDNVKLNSDETNKFIAASKKAGTTEVSKLVKDIMVDTIKSERDSYENEEKLRSEIKDIIKTEKDDLKASLADDEIEDVSKVDDDLTSPDTDNSEDGAIESYLNLVLSSTDARHHTSLFSKIQDVCMEGILHSNEITSHEIPYKTLEKITLESTLPYFDLTTRSITEELESMLVVTESMGDCTENTPDIIAIKKKKAAKTAFICAICVMTIMQVLKTMHLMKPKMGDIKNYVDGETSIKKIAPVSLQNVEDKVNNVINDTRKSVALGSYNDVDLEEVKESLNKVKGLLESLNTAEESATICKNRIINNINTAIESIKMPADEAIGVPDSYYTRYKDENIVSLDHAIGILNKKPTVKGIQVILNSAEECSNNYDVNIELRGVDEQNAPVAMYIAAMHAYPMFGKTVPEVVQECAQYCDLGKKPINIKYVDSGYSVPLKK